MLRFSRCVVGCFAQSLRREPFLANGVLAMKSFIAVLAVIGAVSDVRLLADDELADWRVDLSAAPSVRLQQQTHKTERQLTFTRIHLESTADFQRVQLTLDQPQTRVHDDFSASVKVSSSQSGVQFGLRLVLPTQVDPRSGKQVVTLLQGDAGNETEAWQLLTASGTPATVNDKIRKLRTEMSRSGVDATGAYLDGCVLTAEVHKGTTFIDVGDVEYGPVVSPANDGVPPEPVSAVRLTNRVEIQRGQVVADGQRIFPRFMPDHGESEEFFKRIGVNGVWVGDLNATQRMQSLINQKLLIIATPPHPEFDPADFSTPLQGLPPLETTHSLPSIWYLGTGVTADQMPHLMAWGREVRSADRLLRRPLMADVLSLEGVASRQLDLVGITQHSVGGLYSFGEARNRSYVRQNSSAQLTLPWEWIQTEPSPALSNWRRRLGLDDAVVEPEQVMMQMVALLSSGARGVGFWKTRPLETATPKQQEIAKAVELALLYLDIIEPLLGQGRVEGHIDVKVAGSVNPAEKTNAFWQNQGTQNSNTNGYLTAPAGPDAALINSPGMSLILAGFWDNASQFVPQELFASQGTMTVAATETASAWRVSATGTQGLRRQPTAGGLLINIDDFDQLAIILVSADQKNRQIIEKRVQRNAERAGQLFVELAELKMSRVASTCAEIDNSIAGADTTSAQMFVQARSMRSTAQQALELRDFMSAEKHARACMRELRKIQNRYWYRAVQSLPTPMASPHAVSFSTLPDYWGMAEQIQTGFVSDNLVPSGSFDNLRLLSDGAWKPVSPQENMYHASADIVTENRGDNHILRIRAWRKGENTPDLDKPAILVRSPEINAISGAIYEVTGRVKLGQAIPPDQPAPFLAFDSDLGPEFAVKPTLEPSWRTFRILRQASETGPLKFWMAINGAAEVFVDDFSVKQVAGPTGVEHPLEFAKPEPSPALNTEKASRVQGAGYSTPSFP